MERMEPLEDSENPYPRTAPPPAQSSRSGPSLRTASLPASLALKFAAAALAAVLLLQIIFQGVAMGNMGSAAESLKNLASLKVAEAASPSRSSLPKASGTSCGGLVLDQDQYEHGNFEDNTVGYASDFVTLWLPKSDDRAAYLELALANISAGKALEFGVAAIAARGAYAHYQATSSLGDNDFLWLFQRAGDGSGVDLRKFSLKQRYIDANYKDVWDASVMPGWRARLKQIGQRTGANCEPTHVLVDAGDLVKAGFFALATPPAKQSTPSIDRATARSFEKNIDLTVTYSQLDKLDFTSESEAVVRFCMYSLPEQRMPGRPADDRAGYFLTEFQELGDYRNESWHGRRDDGLLNPTVRLISKMRFTTSDAGKKEIHFYVDPTVPKPLWQATKEGIERWKPAFAQADIGADIIGHMPGDDDWPKDYDVADIRFNTVSWTPGDGEKVFAIGQSVKDPRTGEILKANIMFTLGRMELYLGQRLLFAAFKGSHALQQDARFMQASSRWMHGEREDGALDEGEEQDSSPDLLHIVANMTDDDAFEYVKGGIRQVTSHEVGHTFGLRHNFRGTMSIPFEKAQDPEYTRVHGLTASTMDYPATNVISSATRNALKAKGINADEAFFFTPKIGAYDMWVIRYGYADLSKDKSLCLQDWCRSGPELQKIAAEYDAANFSFATDETGDDFDPYTVRRDLTSDPIRWFKEQFNVTQEAYEALASRTLSEAQPWTSLQRGMQICLGTAELAAGRLTRFVGGITTWRKHGDECTKQGNCKRISAVPIEFDKQKEALEAIVAALTSETGSGIAPPKEIKDQVKLQRDTVAKVDFFGIQPFDLSADVARRQAKVLMTLLSMERLQRLRLTYDIMLDEDKTKVAKALKEELGRNETGVAESNSLMVTWLLGSITKSLIGLPGDMVTDDFKDTLFRESMDDLKIAYLYRLGSLHHSDAPTQSVATAVTAEVSQITAALKEVWSDASLTSRDKGFLSNAVAALRGA